MQSRIVGNTPGRIAVSGRTTARLEIVLDVSTEEFENLVAEALDTIPSELAKLIDRSSA